MFGALMSSSDPISTLEVLAEKRVDNKLFFVIFGESVINDMVVIILWRVSAHEIEQYPTGGIHTRTAVAQFFLVFIGSVGFRFLLGHN